MLNLNLFPQQSKILTCGGNEILYGGAAGGGKSHLLRNIAIIAATAIPGCQIYLFRRKFPDLIANHMDGPQGFRAILGPLVAAGQVQITHKEIRFFHGKGKPISRIKLCHCQHEKDIYNYQGAEIHLLLLDEGTHFTARQYRYLRGRVRAVGIEVPEFLQSLIPGIIVASNPGNVGHGWVKAAWVDDALPEVVRQSSAKEGGMRRVFIPARMKDNPALLQNDPDYELRLEGLGSEALVKALKEGDWSVIEGAYFTEWNIERHVITPFVIPDYWMRFQSYDHGYAKPFSCGWWAVSDGSLVENIRGELCHYPNGALIRYREWYGKSDVDVGVRMTPEEISKGIKERELPGEEIYYRSADPAIFATQTGQSVASLFAKQGIIMQPADNERIAGWTQFRSRLKGVDEVSMVYAFTNCFDSIRTIPALPHSETRPEDLDTDAEDHCADEWRYGLMSQPWVAPKPVRDRVIQEKPITYNELIKQYQRTRRA